jgi:multidrug efflux pump subunit AcrA (membrane-fusion protein)
MDSFVQSRSPRRLAALPSFVGAHFSGRTRPYFVALAVAVSLAAAAGWWWHASALAAPHCVTLLVSRGTIAQSVTATGTVKAPTKPNRGREEG